MKIAYLKESGRYLLEGEDGQQMTVSERDFSEILKEGARMDIRFNLMGLLEDGLEIGGVEPDRIKACEAFLDEVIEGLLEGRFGDEYDSGNMYKAICWYLKNGEHRNEVLFPMDYKGMVIYEKGGLLTVGGPYNDSFDDCTLENLEYGPEEGELVAYCRENGIPLQFDDLRRHAEDVGYEKYLEHMNKYLADPEGSFTDYEMIAPMVRVKSLEQAKGLIDWIDGKVKSCVSEIISDASARLDDGGHKEGQEEYALV